MDDLFDALAGPAGAPRPLADGAVHLPGFVADRQPAFHAAILAVGAEAPFRRLVTPGGRPLSARMTSCGAAGWYSDEHGYRYEPRDPLTGRDWPSIPSVILDAAIAAAAAAGYARYAPDTCLINRYEAGSRMGLHRDTDEGDTISPVVSFSLGLPARFLFGGLTRDAPKRAIRLESGDCVVWGGASRLAYHEVAPIRPGTHPVTGSLRYNLTFRVRAPAAPGRRAGASREFPL